MKQLLIQCGVTLYILAGNGVLLGFVALMFDDPQGANNSDPFALYVVISLVEIYVLLPALSDTKPVRKVSERN